MIVAFLESIKYVGHLLPLAVLRIFLGFQYLNDATHRFNSSFKAGEQFVSNSMRGLQAGAVPHWYEGILNSVILPHHQIFLHVFLVAEFLMGVSFLLGYFVRPTAAIATLLGLHLVFVAQGNDIFLFKALFAVNLTLVWLGAGRCLGIDYFFYKRKRGIWW